MGLIVFALHRLKFDDKQATACRIGVYVYHLCRSAIVHVSEAIGAGSVGNADNALEP